MVIIKSIRIKFDKLVAQTGKANLIRIDNLEHWIPSKLCYNLSTKNNLSGSIEIPSFIYEKIFNCNLSDLSDAEKKHIASWYVEKHEPKKIKFNPNQLPDESLFK